MLKRLGMVVLAVAALGVAARAQEAVEEDEPRPEPMNRIKVLQHPYDIASFYRSSQDRYFGTEEADAKYPIAGFYRSRQGGRAAYGYGPFWNHGYSYRQGGLVVGYRHRIGEHGDLFLFAPTFLAPVGPLNGAFGF